MKTATILCLLTAMIFVATTSAYAQAPVQSINIERGPCLGTCPVYRFSVSVDGTGLFEGRKFTTALGKHGFMVTPEAWAAFQSALAPYRPVGTQQIVLGHPQCKQMATDHPSVSVTWEGGGRVDHLSFNFGCRDPENETMGQALADAPDLLPVADLIERIRLEDGEFHGRN
ncbi:DUF6438 domain-containing protein [Rhizobium croatiense]|nr:DUF6438 domain-containing protein [Rhizobium croatiense]